MPVLQVLLSWSEPLPSWQRDALRRILLQPRLAAADLEDLAELYKESYGLSVTEVVAQPRSRVARQHRMRARRAAVGDAGRLLSATPARPGR